MPLLNRQYNRLSTKNMHNITAYVRLYDLLWGKGVPPPMYIFMFFVDLSIQFVIVVVMSKKSKRQAINDARFARTVRKEHQSYVVVIPSPIVALMDLNKGQKLFFDISYKTGDCQIYGDPHYAKRK